MQLVHLTRGMLSFLFCMTLQLQAQDRLPDDYLSADFHKGRRDAARALMPSNSVMVVFAAPTRTFSNDVEYNYHQNPDLYYFSGYKEPNAVLIIFKDMQKASDGSLYNELFFVQKKDKMAEHWDGRRLGVEGVKKKLGFQHVFDGDDFGGFTIDFNRFDRIIMDYPPEDIRSSNDPGNLYQLVTKFKEKASIPAIDRRIAELEGVARNYMNKENREQMQAYIIKEIGSNTNYLQHPVIKKILSISNEEEILAFKQAKEQQKFSTALFDEITTSLREIKTPEELALIRKAVEISCRGQNEVMKAVHPDMSELEVQGLHEYIHKRYGAEGIGYGSIIGAGENGCILHYTENTKTQIGTDMILMDVGAEYHGYTADVTRTIPADGKFSKEERAIYQLVYDAQEAAFKTLKDGSTWADAGNAAKEVIAVGLQKLGIIKNKEEVGNYYTHGLGHHIGLDVHDKGSYDTLKKNMVITIEPGIYIPANSNCDKKWWSISVRIEDDALITQNGYELLSVFAPRKIEEIEKLIAENSLLDQYKLPALKTGEKKKDF
ncbi:MAG: aminopeptidase P N-terminal domain-containing protein [Flavisolibacter sp.]